VHADGSTLVIEDGVVTKRVRRPSDLLRFALVSAVIVGTLAFASFLESTVSGLDSDLAKSATYLPTWVALPLGALSGLGLLLLPVGIAINLTMRHRTIVILESAGGFLLAASTLTALGWYLQTRGSAAIWFALAGTNERDAIPLQPYLSGVVAVVTIARVRERGRGGTLSLSVIAASALTVFLAGGVTVVSTATTLLVGWAAGLLVRYTFGTPTTRPRGIRVADALARAGFPVTILRATASTDKGRRYTARTEEGRRLHVAVYDRDLEGSGMLSRWWRSLRMRDPDALGGHTMRETLDRAVLISQAAREAGAPVPHLLFARTIDADSCMVGFEYIEGVTLARIIEAGEEVDDHLLVSAWHAVASLHDAAIAHRGLSPDHLVRDREGTLRLLHPTSGAVAMNDLQERIDLADMLVSLSLASTPERAVATGVHAIGPRRIARALPALQPFALATGTRRMLRRHKGTLQAIRDEVVRLTLTPDAPVEQVQIERLSPRRVITAVAGLVAAYLLVGQLGQVDLIGLFRTADYGWVGVAAVASLLTFIGAALALQGFVAERLSLWRTFLAQLAAGFATLVSPPTLGTVAVNVRFLQRAKVPAAAAGASVALSQVLAFFIHIALLFIMGVIAGTTQAFTFEPPKEAIVAIGAIVFVLGLLMMQPAIRRWIAAKARPSLAPVVPRLALLAQSPRKLALGIGGMLLLNLAFCAALFASVRAFDGAGAFAAISLVYLAGSTIGQAAPTPGGVGAVETVMTAGLVAAGLDSTTAVPAVLLFRLLTFWLPTIPGYLAFHGLQRRDQL
jgi:uncharacterized membrane protein YbhN (UPF0104 family)/tRNA A-37 threonylcarbamoyl transferase component Bud32